MATITYNLTDDQLAEMLLALDHHQGNEAGTADAAAVKAWGLKHFQAMVQNYRASVINAANPVGTGAAAS
jgi:hypothetical protein|tara:strand:+ start:113 stop:322 length:210 start_codon:yes stop_codon:yes gene_type:complete